jgi:hypothetical protein
MMYSNYYVYFFYSFKHLNLVVVSLCDVCVYNVSFYDSDISGFGAHVVFISRCKVRALLVEYVLVPHSDIWFVDESSEYTVYVLWLT